MNIRLPISLLFASLVVTFSPDVGSQREYFERLTRQGIVEVIVWEFSREGLGAAVPFKHGCAVSRYGDPDTVEKLPLIIKSYRLIIERGLNDPSVGDCITQLLMLESEPYESIYDVSMINKLRPFVRKLNSYGGEETLFS